MLRKLLTSRQDELLARERRALASLQTALGQMEAGADDMLTLQRAMAQLDELFLLVVVGEFNAGKTAFINALLSEKVLLEGVTPTTAQIHLLRYGERTTGLALQPGQDTAHDGGELPTHPTSDSHIHEEPPATRDDILVVTYDAPWLRDINIVDTPGTNAVIQRHQKITEDFIPRSDLILFVTSADRPFSESERQFLTRIRDWGKKVVFVINKIDILEDDEQVERIMGYVRTNAAQLLGTLPEVFAVSARQALRAKRSQAGPDKEALWRLSRFGPLESYILKTLDEKERVRLKLANPLGVAARLADKYGKVAADRLDLLREDMTTIDSVETQLTAYTEDMRRDFRFHLSHVENVLHEMQQRGNDFFDETLRLGRIFDLLSTERIRGQFEREVVADTSQRIETEVHQLIDWMVDKDYREWQSVTEYLNRRAAQHQDRIVGQVGGPFDLNRKALLASVGEAARNVVATYNREQEARELAESVQMAVAQTALVEVGAIGLGAILLKVLATTVADVSGVLLASSIAALGLYVIPNKRRQAKNDLRVKIADLRERLSAAMSTQFERELARSLQRIREAIAPYTRFVRSEQGKLERISAELAQAKLTVAGLRIEVEKL